MIHTHPQAIANFRANTETSAQKMAGVCFLTFWCPQCKTVNPVRGRKSRGHKMGFMCSSCVEKRDARIKAKSDSIAM